MHGMDRNKNFGGDATSGPMAAMMRRVKGIIALPSLLESILPGVYMRQTRQALETYARH